ncbi:hypothetical protein CEG14_10760 [Bordetella genomosp. 1]|uniref:Alpha-2 type XI collagen n=1 Tax=Bordetella genomosp. 1 TaxID=1395607 RepID=A0A261SDR6_9BORD|nr:DUF4381 family protein [Bordetella genomosp. 1]OZI35549.1 hypothetical protein CEG14_10760 [Bordetella genomosp. 1]
MSAPGLDHLRELPLPPAVGLWPQTWGWAALAAVVLLLAGAFGWRAWRQWRRDRYRRAALAALDALERQAGADAAAARALPALLKRTALAALPAAARSRVAALEGQAWVDWLNAQVPAPAFATGSAQGLRALAYAPPAAAALPRETLAGLFGASRRWMERHHVAA